MVASNAKAGMKHSISRRSWRQNLAQGGASAASGTLGRESIFHPARLAGERICRSLKRAREFFWQHYPGLRFAPLRFAPLALGQTLPPAMLARWSANSRE